MIEIKNLQKTYNQKDLAINALDNISVNLPSKGLVFIVGKSGSGKSTLLNVLGALDSFDSGDIIVENKSMIQFTEEDANDYRNSYVGFVFQEFNLIDEYNVEKNISLGHNFNHDDSAKIDDLLSKVDLKDMGRRKPNTLSGGQKQRVAIARALIKNPQILLCDEPTGQLDYETSESIFKLLKEISKDKLVIIVSHDIESAKKYGDRIIKLKDGKIEEDTDPQIITKTDNDLVLKRYKLDFKNTVLLALGFLKTRPIRLFLALFLSILVFVMLCFSDTIGSYNQNKVILEHLYENQNDYISYHKKLYGKDSENETFNLSSNMNDEDINFIKNELSLDNYTIVYDDFGITKYNIGQMDNSNVNYSDYYKNSIEGFTEINDDFIKQYNYKLTGNIPTKDDEVVITKYAYEIYEKFGYKETDGAITNINSMNELIGKTLYNSVGYSGGLISFKSYKIVGVLDTRFNYDRYKNALTSTDRGLTSILNIEINQMMSYGLHNVVYVRDNYYYDNIGKFNKTQYKENFSVEMHQVVANRNSEELFAGIASYNNKSNLPVYLKNDAQTNLSNNQILLPLSCATFVEKDKIDEMVRNFAYENYDYVSEHFDQYYEYAHYIIENIENIYQPEYNYAYFEKQVYQRLLKDDFFQAFDSFKIIKEMGQYKYEKNVEVIGFYNDFKDGMEFKPIYCSEKLFSEVKETFGYLLNDYKCLVVPLWKSYNKDIKLLKYRDNYFSNDEYIHEMNASTESSSYVVDNEVVYSINNVEGYLEIVNIIFKFASLGLMLIVILFISFYFSGVIIDKEKEIGILRALGASKKDVTKIFLVECLIISLISIIISLIISIVLNNVLNNFITDKFYLTKDVYSFGIRQILMVVLIEVIVFMVGIIMPLMKLMKKKPVDIIAKR